MSRPPLEVADIFREFKDEYLKLYGSSTSFEQRKAIEDICQCRTAALGGHLWQCSDCGKEEPCYNSCRNRNCNKCQGKDISAWLKKRAKELLPIHYFHVIFTIPHEFSVLALQNQETVYGILFRASADTLLEVAKNPENLGADIGFFGMLHTWGQLMNHHPHAHYVIPGGGISLDGNSWIPSKSEKWFASVKILTEVFRGKFISQLKKAYRKGKLGFYGETKELEHPAHFERLLNRSCQYKWTVYCQPPFSSAEIVLKYLAPYTRKVCISNYRLVSCIDGRVTFTYRDYRDDSKIKETTLGAVEFIRRYLIHVTPKNFYRIRHYGFLSNNQKKESLKLCRKLIGCEKFEVALPVINDDRQETNKETSENNTSKESFPCPHCKTGLMICKSEIPTMKEEKQAKPP